VLHGRNDEKAQHACEVIGRLHRQPNCIRRMPTFPNSMPWHAWRKTSQPACEAGCASQQCGVYMTGHKVSKDGFEITLAVNYVAHFLLTMLLLPLLKKSAEPRVVTSARLRICAGTSTSQPEQRTPFRRVPGLCQLEARRCAFCQRTGAA